MATTPLPGSTIFDCTSHREHMLPLPVSPVQHSSKRARSPSPDEHYPTKRPAGTAPATVISNDSAAPMTLSRSSPAFTTPLSLGAATAAVPNGRREHRDDEPPATTSDDPMDVDLPLPSPQTHTRTSIPLHRGKPRNARGTSKTTSEFTGRSRSSLAAQRLKAAVADGSFERNPTRNLSFLQKLADLDEHAEVKDTKDGTYIWHSACGKWFKTKDGGPYSLQLFSAHVKSCKPGTKQAKAADRSRASDSTARSSGESDVGRQKEQTGENGGGKGTDVKNDGERSGKKKTSNAKLKTRRTKIELPPQKNTLLSWTKKIVQHKTASSPAKGVIDAVSQSPGVAADLTAGERSQVLPLGIGESPGATTQNEEPKPEIQSVDDRKPALKTSTLLTWARKLGWSSESRVKSKASKTIRSHASVQVLPAPVSSGTEASPESTLESNPRPRSRRACQGLTGAADERVPIYVRQALVSGAGSTSVHKISRTLFSQSFKTLTPKQKMTVEAAQLQERTWRNDIWSESVFATSCSGFIEVLVEDGPVVCSHCLALLKQHRFQTALNKAIKKKTRKVKHQFRNRKYRSDTLAALFARSAGLEALIMDEVRLTAFVPLHLVFMFFICFQSPDATAYKRLAVGLLEGKLSGYPIVSDLLRALAEQVDREERGVGRQNFKYGPTLNEFAHMAAIISPELYRILSKHLPLPALRHLK